MKNYQKGFLIPLVIVIIAMVAIGGGAYVYTNTNKKSTDESITATTSSEIKTTETTTKPVTTVPAKKKPTISCAALNRNMVVGSIGDDVFELQRYLVESGYLPKVNFIQKGTFDISTQNALIKLQEKFNIIPEDLGIPQRAGNLDPTTRTFLSKGCTNTKLVARPIDAPTTPPTPTCTSGETFNVLTGMPCPLNLNASASTNVTMVYPNGGEIFSIGGTIPTIKWIVPSHYNPIELVLMPVNPSNTNSPIYSAKLKGYGFGGRIPQVNNPAAKNTPMIMTNSIIDQSIPPGQYKMRVYYYAEGQDYTQAQYQPLGYDDSDASFTINK